MKKKDTGRVILITVHALILIIILAAMAIFYDIGATIAGGLIIIDLLYLNKWLYKEE